MSVDLLQEKIRKCKNPAMVELAMDPEWIPGAYLQACESVPRAWGIYCRELLEALKDTLPAVRLSMGCAVYGADGIHVLEEIAAYASELGYYVMMDAPVILSPAQARNACRMWMELNLSDAWVVSPWLGSDVIRPLIDACKKGKAVFAVARSANKSAFELQDLLTGSRHVHVAAMDLVNRHAETLPGKFGYSQMGALLGATAANVIRSARTKYSRMFFLLDGVDYSGANYKNCSYAFDKFGRGAIVCAGSSVMGAWKEEAAPENPVEAACQAAERMKKNLSRYINVL